MSVDQAMRTAETLFRQGRRAEAARACREVLDRRADHPDALHVMGMLAAQDGRLDEGAETILRSIEARPHFPEAWASLGCVLVNKGCLTEALAAYRRLSELVPDDARAPYAAGIILRDLGRTADAVDSFREATRLRPKWAEAHLKLGMALRKEGRLDEAVDAYRRAIDAQPDLADAHNNLGNALRDLRRPEEAIAAYAEAVRLSPRDPVPRVNLTAALLLADRPSESLAAGDDALRLDPTSAGARNETGAALARLRRFDEALARHARAVGLHPDDAATHEAMGATLLLKHDMAGAAVAFRRALALSPGAAPTWNGLGMALRSLGQFDEAADCFRRALALEPDNAFFHRNLSLTGRRDAGADELARLAALLGRDELPVDERVDAGFALGKLLDDSGRFDDAFAAFDHANRLYVHTRRASGGRYDAGRVAHAVDRTIQSFSRDFFRDRRGWGEESELPVFIVGMPRSGTTLVEQIAASHPAVFGAGELTDVEAIATSLAAGGDRADGGNLDQAAVGAAASAHVRTLRNLAREGGRADALRVTDKMPGNVFRLGLIATLFPAARVIVCRRDPRDTCLSCYFQHFARSDPHPYAYDLADCARHFVQNERLIEHWLRALPLKVLEVRYEDLVADQERQTRRLIEFLGLPWDASCLDFHKTRRTVVTTSVWQVRQPMYTRSAGRWRNYKRHLGPLLEVLAEKTQ